MVRQGISADTLLFLVQVSKYISGAQRLLVSWGAGCFVTRPCRPDRVVFVTPVWVVSGNFVVFSFIKAFFMSIYTCRQRVFFSSVVATIMVYRDCFQPFRGAVSKCVMDV